MQRRDLRRLRSSACSAFRFARARRTRLLWQFAIVAALLLAISPRARARAARCAIAGDVLRCALTVLAMWLSLGPLPHAGRPRLGLRAVRRALRLRARLRRPSRAGALRDDCRTVPRGARGLWRAARSSSGRAGAARRRSLSVVVRVVVILVEGAFAPDGDQPHVGPERGHAAGARRPAGRARPRLSHASRRCRPARVITEFPFGDPAWELRYVYYSTVHWKRIVNGYSGGFPQATRRASRACSARRGPEDAWQALATPARHT